MIILKSPAAVLISVPGECRAEYGDPSMGEILVLWAWCHQPSVCTSTPPCMLMWPLYHASLQYTSLILDIHFKVNWHLSNQGIHWPVSHDHIVGSSLVLIEFSSFFLSWPLNEEITLIIKVATGNIKTRTIQNLLFSLTLQAVRINNPGALLLGLVKSIYY